MGRTASRNPPQNGIPEPGRRERKQGAYEISVPDESSLSRSLRVNLR